MFSVRRLTGLDLDRVLVMQEIIYKGLQDKSIFQRSTQEFVAYCLAEGGVCFGAFAPAGELVAYRLSYFPRDRAFNLGIGVVPPSEFEFVAHMDTTAVLHHWRQHGLANRLNSEVLTALRDSEVRHLFATASPFNPNSVRALLKTGLRTIAVIENAGGKLRLLFYRPFPGWWVDPEKDESEAQVSLLDVPQLRTTMLAGAVGVKVADHSGEQMLVLRRPPTPVAI